MIILKLSGFYIKYLDPRYETGQYNVLGSKVEHKLLLDAVNDLHSRMTLAFYDPKGLCNFKEALEKSDELIKKEVSSAVQAHLNNHNVNITVNL